MAAHTNAQRAFIVCRLAAYDTTADIVKLFMARFPDTSCTEQDVLATDPRVAIVDPDLHSLFAREREAVLSDPAKAPYAEQQARLIVLSKDVDRYRGNNQPAEARAVLRQIAEEVGAVGPGKGGSAAPKVGDEIVEIIRTIVDPKGQDGASTGNSNAAGVPAAVPTPPV